MYLCMYVHIDLVNPTRETSVRIGGLAYGEYIYI